MSELVQTRLTNRPYHDINCSGCGVIIPKGLSKCSNCSFNDSFKMIKIRKLSERYGLFAKAEKQLKALRDRKHKFTNRGSR